MAYSVIEADVQKDKHTMLTILRNNRSRAEYDYEARYDWVYLNNPLGRARAWIIQKNETGEAVGFTGVFPRAVYVNGQRFVGWNCGDFSIEKKFRSLGIALKLRKAAKKAIDQGDIPFLYAHPNERMEVIHLKSGHKKMAHMKRYALPVRTDAFLSHYIPVHWLMRLFAIPLNVLLSYHYRFRIFTGLNAQNLEQVEVDERHNAVAAKMTEQFNVVGSRDVEYLRWKFAQNPNASYRQLDMFYKEELVGTVFYTKRERVIYVWDILVDDIRRFGDQLMRYFINRVRRMYPDIVSVSFILQEYNPLVDVLKKTGFKYRDDATSAAIVYVNEEQQPQLAKHMLNGANWYMTVGDRDA